MGMTSAPSKQQEFTVLFPFGVLKDSPALLDPKNTQNTAEYYLLENLTCGLVRDSLSDPRGYAGCLAERWKQITPTEWKFWISTKAQWSDRSPITLEQIRDHLLDLKQNPTRHIQMLRKLQDVVILRDERALTLKFSTPMGEWLLHELSLADSGILPINYASKGWGVTAGAYSVVSYKPKQELILKLNPEHPFSTPHSPRTVRLFRVPTLEEQVEALKTGKMSLYSAAAFTWQKRFREFDKVGVKILEGFPNTIHFLVPNLEHPEAKAAENRSAFANLVQKTARETNSDRLTPETQMLPQGYAGRLEKTPMRSKSALKPGTRLDLEVWAEWKEHPEFFDRLVTNAKDLGLDLRVHYSGGKEKIPQGIIPFAKTSAFKGNQKDALGSWSFLFNETNGDLKRSLPQFASKLTQSIQASTPVEREQALASIHTDVLAGNLAIPTFAERSRTYHQSNIDLSAWNIYDTRLRLYEVRSN
jgi:MarR-like DNA-binding transcriptional regulator SgrR of sgrS sRNA